MPQLDIFTFDSTLRWFFFTLGMIYFAVILTAMISIVEIQIAKKQIFKLFFYPILSVLSDLLYRHNLKIRVLVTSYKTKFSFVENCPDLNHTYNFFYKRYNFYETTNKIYLKHSKRIFIYMRNVPIIQSGFSDYADYNYNPK